MAQTLRDLRIALPGKAEIVGQGALRDGRGGFDLDVHRLNAADLCQRWCRPTSPGR